MRPSPNPVMFRKEPVRATKPFLPIFEADLSPEMLVQIMDAGKGWAERSEHWGALHDTKKRQWPNPACSSYAAFNAFEPFATLQKQYGIALDMDPMDVHEIAMEIDGLEGGDANTQTTVQAAMEAVCQLANKATGTHWVSWARVPTDIIGAWQSVVSPVAVELKIWREWLRYSFIWRTLIWPHDHAQLVALHAVALVGWKPKKKICFWRDAQAFEVHDSAREKIWIEASAMVRSMLANQGYGFIRTRDVIHLRGNQEADGFR